MRNDITIPYLQYTRLMSIRRGFLYVGAVTTNLEGRGTEARRHVAVGPVDLTPADNNTSRKGYVSCGQALQLVIGWNYHLQIRQRCHQLLITEQHPLSSSNHIRRQAL
ncbi:hypothetical protein CERSUDRAFT_113421 [Gelatoporia subvermispora B]|uniref:Uncharacterized protein n=1 Tax=Ceriporiopsis subvermispora (strain B) TaxID=914234 RepID=M2RIF2_CERS8|nr:hypothetical protein CERSUDRAFT_113421 [Gelatoporia subvermispora B]